MPRQVSFAVESFGYVWDQTANGGLGDWVKATQTGSGGSAGGLTNAELRASPVPVQATLDPAGLATDTGQATGNASLASIDTKLTGPVAVSLASVPSHPVTGPLTDTQLRAVAVPVSGVFFQGTQPVSATSWPLPTGSATEATLAALNGKVTAVNTGAVSITAALPAGGNAIGTVAIKQSGVAWNANHVPAVAVAATITKAAAGVGVKNVCTSITVTLSSTAAPTVGSVQFVVRDGAAGSGPIIWTGRLSIPAVAGNSANLSTGWIWLEGTANTAMVVESVGAPPANTFATVSMTGTTV